jgi:hypothetical protein
VQTRVECSIQATWDKAHSILNRTEPRGDPDSSLHLPLLTPAQTENRRIIPRSQYSPSSVADDDGLQTETSNARPKQTIGDNHDLWQKIRSEESPLGKETNVVTQSDDEQCTRKKPGDGTPRRITSGEGLSIQGRPVRTHSAPILMNNARHVSRMPGICFRSFFQFSDGQLRRVTIPLPISATMVLLYMQIESSLDPTQVVRG